MRIGRSANPALGKNAFKSGLALEGEESMTVQGAVSKSIILALLVLAGAIFTWNRYFEAIDGDGFLAVRYWMIGGGIGGFIVALITIFKKTLSPYTAPLYAVLEGFLLGGLSAFIDSTYVGEGIVLQAVALTMGTLFAMLFAYKAKLIRPTRKFRMGVIAATGGIFLVYVISWIVGLFGVQVGFLHGNSMLSIGISLFIVVIAALNLVLDFDFIDQGAQSGAPKFMEWYAAFGLIVTLVWLYIEILRLLSKIASRN